MPWPFWWTNSGAQRKKWRTISVGPRLSFKKRLTQIISAILVDELRYAISSITKLVQTWATQTLLLVLQGQGFRAPRKHVKPCQRLTAGDFRPLFPSPVCVTEQTRVSFFSWLLLVGSFSSKNLVYRLYRLHDSIVWWVKEERLRRCGWVPRGGQRAEQKGTTVFSGRNPSQDGEGKYI